MSGEKIKAVCIKADVMGSRTNNKEYELKLIVEKLNIYSKNNLLTEFVLRAGDEIFGIVNDFTMGYKVFKELFYLSNKHNVSLYVGVGFGDIYKDNLENPNMVNGQAIWNSTDALQALKLKKQGSYITSILPSKFKFMFLIGGNWERSMIANCLLYFIFERKIKRTDKQNQAIRLIEKFPELNYEEIGLKLGYEQKNAQVNVSKLLNRAHYNIISETENKLIKLINLLYEE